MDAITHARVMDPGRGAFCAVTKHGVPLNLPPTKREPLVNRETNPRGTRRIHKTFQDSQPVKERKRYQDWLRRQG